ncbi:MAG: hypothetical protein IT377_33370 [Polyangiaceae bacterium]|nr:hypothetical protein [Polyangiaceae bacterium]
MFSSGRQVCRVVGVVLAMLGASSCESGSETEAVQCSAECPDGTSRATYDRVVSGEAGVVVSSSCETACAPILPCAYPNLPLISDDGSGKASYTCEPLEGYSAIPKDDEVDFGWAAAAHCIDGTLNEDETGPDCGGTLCPPC